MAHVFAFRHEFRVFLQETFQSHFTTADLRLHSGDIFGELFDSTFRLSLGDRQVGDSPLVFGQAKFFGLDAAFESQLVELQGAQFGLSGNQRRFGAEHAHEESAVLIEEFSLKRDEADVRTCLRSKLERDLEGLNDPGVAEEPFGKSGDSAAGSNELIPHDSGFRAYPSGPGETRRRRLSRSSCEEFSFCQRIASESPAREGKEVLDKSDARGQATFSGLDVFHEGIEVGNDDGLRASTEGDFQECGILQVNHQEFGHTSHDRVPRRDSGTGAERISLTPMPSPSCRSSRSSRIARRALIALRSSRCSRMLCWISSIPTSVSSRRSRASRTSERSSSWVCAAASISCAASVQFLAERLQIAFDPGDAGLKALFGHFQGIEAGEKRPAPISQHGDQLQQFELPGAILFQRFAGIVDQ